MFRTIAVPQPIVLFAVFLLSFGVAAAQQSYFTVAGEDFLEETRLIFVGKLIDKESFRTEDGIFTRYTFQVSDTIKGETRKQIAITEYGGTVGDLRLTLSHNPNYSLGQEYLVFSYPDLLEHNRTFAGPLGQFRVITDGSGRRSVRIYSSHPLRDVLGQEHRVFQDLDDFSGRLRARLESSPR